MPGYAAQGGMPPGERGIRVPTLLAVLIDYTNGFIGFFKRLTKCCTLNQHTKEIILQNLNADFSLRLTARSGDLALELLWTYLRLILRGDVRSWKLLRKCWSCPAPRAQEEEKADADYQQ